MVELTKPQIKKEKIKRYLKIYLILFTVIFVLSILIQLEEHNIEEKGNPLVKQVEKNCNNANQTLNRTFEEGKQYNILRSNFKNGKYDCYIIDMDTEPNTQNSLIKTIKED